MTVTYTYTREIYDIEQLFQYIKNTLSTIQSISYNSGTINTIWPNALSSGDQTILNGLITSYSNPSVLIQQNQYRKISVGNSTTTPLISLAVFTGFWEDISQYSNLSLIIITDASSSLQIQYSTDGSNIDDSTTIAITANKSYNHSSQNYSRFCRIIVTNGSTAQTFLRLQTIYHYTKTSIPTISLGSDVASTNDVIVGKNALMGKCIDGSYIDIATTANRELKVNLPLSAFGEVIITEKYPIIQTDFLYGYNSQTSKIATTGSGSIVQNSNLVSIRSGAAINSSSSISTIRRIRYRPGQGISTYFTGIFDTPQVGNIQMAGCGDADNGLFFGYNGLSFGIMRRSNGVDQWIAQSSWNSDKMDGSGKSGQILNTAKGNIYNIEFQWLGFGLLKFGISESTTGSTTLVHAMSYANLNTTPSLYYPIFPMTAICSNTSNTTQVALNICCLNAFFEGVPRLLGPRFGFENSKLCSSSTSPFDCLFTIRNKTTYRSLLNKLPIHIFNLTAATDNQLMVIKLLKNATLSGTPTWIDINTNDSVVEYTTNSVSVSNGNEIMSVSLPKAGNASFQFQIYDIVLEPGDTLSIGVRDTVVQSTTVLASLNWVEDQ